MQGGGCFCDFLCGFLYVLRQSVFYEAQDERTGNICSARIHQNTYALSPYPGEFADLCRRGLCGTSGGGIAAQRSGGGITAVLGLTVDSSRIPLINLRAAAFCLLTVLAVLAALTLSNARLLWRSALMETIRMERRTEKPFRLRPAAGVFGVLLLFAGYGLALDMGERKGFLLE